MRARTRVTFYSDALYFGGAEMYLALLAEHLDSDLFELSAVLPPDAGADRLRGLLAAHGATTHTLARPGFAFLRSVAGMRRVFREVGGEVLHMNLPSSYDAGVSSIAWAARDAGYRRVISTEHLPMIDRKYRKFPKKVFFSHWVDRIVVMTEQNRRFLIERHGMDAEKIRVLENGVNDPSPLSAAERAELRLAWGVAPDELLVGIVASLETRKGHRVLLDALVELDRMGDAIPWKLVAIGQGPDRDALVARTEALGLSSRVRWVGPRDDAARAIGAFDLFVLPSFIESMPLSLLEAMAARVPTIGSAVYGIPEVIADGETGLLVPVGEATALARALRELLLDPQRRARLGEAGRRRFDTLFRAERMASRVAALYAGEEPDVAAVAAQASARPGTSRESEPLRVSAR